MDNVDQLDPHYQSKIFLLAQHITRSIRATTVVSLREESYYTASVQSTFTAYTNRKFHIASPWFRRMIGLRIAYATMQLRNAPDDMRELLHGYTFDSADISEFLTIVQSSIFEWSKVLSRFIEALCFGNMRLALEMFSMFLTSGATDVNKMLLIYRRDGNYHVAFHEFLKAIMLGDRRYYKEEYSRVLNIFNVTAEKNSSHFTTARLVNLLLLRRGESNTEGRGYVEIGRIIGMFEDIFDNVRDTVVSLDRLVRAQLIEVNTRSTSTTTGASHVRVTSAGWYYMRHLAHKFAYLDLVLQDTPLDNRELEGRLRASMYRVDNLGDREENKIDRVGARFERVWQFLGYLEAQEGMERERYDLERLEGPLADPIMPQIIEKLRREQHYVERRLAENRALLATDFDESDEESDDWSVLVGDDEQQGQLLFEDCDDESGSS